MPVHAGKSRLRLLIEVALFNCMPLEMPRAAVAGRDPPVADQRSRDVKLLGSRPSPIAERQQKRNGRRRAQKSRQRGRLVGHYCCYYYRHTMSEYVGV
jgi:hypothetical protein